MATYSLFGSTVPSNFDSVDPNALNLGTAFMANVDGAVNGVRYYRHASQTGNRNGYLWTSGGTLLASVAFSGETTGWNEALFSTPVEITADTIYIVSYSISGAYYSADGSFFASSGYTNDPLYAPQDGEGGQSNGVYIYASPGAFPNSSFGSTNYYADVIFEPASGDVTDSGTPSSFTLTTVSANAAIGASGTASSLALTAANASDQITATASPAVYIYTPSDSLDITAYHVAGTPASYAITASEGTGTVSAANLTYVGGTTGSGTSAAYDVSLSGLGIQQNDIVVVATGFASTTNGDPGVNTTGYTEVADLYSDDTRDANLAIAYKVQGATPDTSINVNGSGSATDSAVTAVHVWRGVDTTTPIDVTITTATGINTGTFDSPSITPTTTGAIVLSLGLGTSLNARTSPTAPTGYGNQVNDSTDPGNAAVVGIASKAWSGSGAEDPGSWGNLSTAVADSWAAATLVLRPATSGTIGLVVADTAQSQSADAVSLVQASTLAITEAAQSATADVVVLAQFSILAIADSGQANTADAVDITQQASLALADSAHSVVVDPVSLEQASTIAVDGSLHEHIAESTALLQDSTISISDALHSKTVDNVDLFFGTPLDISDANHSALVDGIVLEQTQLLSLDDVSSLHTVGNVVLQITFPTKLVAEIYRDDRTMAISKPIDRTVTIR